MAEVVKRFEIYLVNLDPIVGFEIKKSRPCMIISPDVMNKNLKTVIAAPMTTKIRNYPSRVGIVFEGKKGQVALDQLRTIDKSRLIRKLGKPDSRISLKILGVLREMFT